MRENLNYLNKLLNVREVADLLGCSKSTVWRRVKNDIMPGPIKICGTTRWVLRELLDYLDSQISQRDCELGGRLILQRVNLQFL